MKFYLSYSQKLRLLIEIDDDSHDRKWENNRERIKHLNILWIEIIRYNNKDIYYQLNAVMISLEMKIKEREITLGLIK